MYRQNWSKLVRNGLRSLILALLLTACFSGAYFFWWLPSQELNNWRNVIGPKEALTLENQIRQTLAQAFGGTVLLIGLFFTWRTIRQAEENLRATQANALANIKISQENVRLAQEGQITERFMRAIDQLGALDQQGRKRLELRLGGVYALERIAHDSEKDHWPIMEVLTAYVRENASYESTREPRQPPADIQAILTVIGRSARLQWLVGQR
jgi:hypothetical protein